MILMKINYKGDGCDDGDNGEDKMMMVRVEFLVDDLDEDNEGDSCDEGDDGCDDGDNGEDKMMIVMVLTMHIVFGESKLLTLQLLVLSKHDPLTLSFTALSL